MHKQSWSLGNIVSFAGALHRLRCSASSRAEPLYRWAITISGDQTRCGSGAAITAAIKAKAKTSPSCPHSAVRLLCPMAPLQVGAAESKPGGTYGEGEVERSSISLQDSLAC